MLSCGTITHPLTATKSLHLPCLVSFISLTSSYSSCCAHLSPKYFSNPALVYLAYCSGLLAGLPPICFQSHLQVDTSISYCIPLLHKTLVPWEQGRQKEAGAGQSHQRASSRRQGSHMYCIPMCQALPYAC